MQYGRVAAMATTAMVFSFSPAAYACGGSSGLAALASVGYALLMALLLSVIAVLSLRGASRALGRMRRVRPGRAIAAAHIGTSVLYALSIASTVLCGGLLFAGLLLFV